MILWMQGREATKNRKNASPEKSGKEPIWEGRRYSGGGRESGERGI